LEETGIIRIKNIAPIPGSTIYIIKDYDEDTVEKNTLIFLQQKLMKRKLFYQMSIVPTVGLLMKKALEVATHRRFA